MTHAPRCLLLLCLLTMTSTAHASEPRDQAGSPSSPPASSGVLTAADGVKLHYLEAGRGPAILFVPGWTISADIWQPQIAHFSSTMRVVALDPRAQGESEKTSEGLYPAMRARDIKAVIDTLKLAPVVLVGWSMGVAEAAAFVEQFGTADLSAIVLVDGIAGGPYDPKVTPEMLGFAAALQKDRRAQTAGFVKGMYRTPQTEAYLARVTEASLQTPTSAALALLVGSMASDYRDALEKIDKPTLFAVASGSYWDAAFEDMRTRIANCRFEKFEGAGHALFVDEADRFNRLVDEFLASVKR